MPNAAWIAFPVGIEVRHANADVVAIARRGRVAYEDAGDPRPHGARGVKNNVAASNVDVHA
jgi:hypothetical protein